MEHPAVLGAIGERARLVDLGRDGAVDPERLALSGAGACSVQWANHEVGTLQPIGEIAARCRAAGVVFHTDAVQAAGKVAIDVAAVPVDLLSLSAHKFGGPMGVGALYARPGLLPATSQRGGQERGRRPGTENVIGVVGMGAACAVAATQLERRADRVGRLGRRLEDGLVALGARIHGGSGRLGGTVNFAFSRVAGDALVQALDLEGIRVSTGAACTSGTLAASPVLLAMGFSEVAAREAVRASLGAASTERDVDRLLSILPDIIERIRCHDPAPAHT
jgi:cysteine desulfurase